MALPFNARADLQLTRCARDDEGKKTAGQKVQEDHRDDLIVILAGLRLLAIAKLQAGGKGYTLDERCDANLLAYFNAVQLTRARDAGNGRLARNKVEEAILNQSRRLVAQPEADLCLLLPEDFQLDDVGGV